jgi:hypothetical protein
MNAARLLPPDIPLDLNSCSGVCLPCQFVGMHSRAQVCPKWDGATSGR